MGGYGLYVWGSFGVTALVMAVEVVSLRARRKALREADHDPHDEPASELLKRIATDRDQRTRQATASKSDSRKRTTRRKKP